MKKFSLFFVNALSLVLILHLVDDPVISQRLMLVFFPLVVVSLSLLIGADVSLAEIMMPLSGAMTGIAFYFTWFHFGDEITVFYRNYHVVIIGIGGAILGSFLTALVMRGSQSLTSS